MIAIHVPSGETAPPVFRPANCASGTRVPPVAAMRDDVALPSRGLQVRGVLGTVLTLAGTALMVWAVTNADLGGRLQLAGLAAAAILIGVIVLAPVEVMLPPPTAYNPMPAVLKVPLT